MSQKVCLLPPIYRSFGYKGGFFLVKKAQTAKDILSSQKIFSLLSPKIVSHYSQIFDCEQILKRGAKVSKCRLLSFSCRRRSAECSAVRGQRRLWKISSLVSSASVLDCYRCKDVDVLAALKGVWLFGHFKHLILWWIFKGQNITNITQL